MLVGQVIEVDPAILLDPFIDFAHELVSELCENSGYTTNRKTYIETWLAAHFYAIRDPQVVTDNVGQLQTQFRSKVDYRLKLTHEGQQAILLDTAGKLAALDNTLQTVKTILPPSTSGRSAVTFLGVPTSQQQSIMDDFENGTL